MGALLRSQQRLPHSVPDLRGFVGRCCRVCAHPQQSASAPETSSGLAVADVVCAGALDLPRMLPRSFQDQRRMPVSLREAQRVSGGSHNTAVS